MDGYKFLTLLRNLFLTIAVIALATRWAIQSKFLIIGLPLLISLIFLVLTLTIIFFRWVMYSHKKADNPILAIKSYEEYFDKVGYAVFAGGLVALVTTQEKSGSYGLIFIGVSCMLIGMLNKNRYERFENSIK